MSSSQAHSLKTARSCWSTAGRPNGHTQMCGICPGGRSKRVSRNYKPSRVRCTRSSVFTSWRSPLHGWASCMPAVVRTPFTWASGKLETGLALRPTAHLRSMTTSHGSGSASWAAFPSCMGSWRQWFILCLSLSASAGTQMSPTVTSTTEEPRPTVVHVLGRIRQAGDGRRLLILQELRTVKELLGHSTIRRTADTCGHVLPARARQVASAIDRVLGEGGRRESLAELGTEINQGKFWWSPGDSNP